MSEQGRRRPRPLGVALVGIAVVALVALVASLSLDEGTEEPAKVVGAGTTQQLIGGIPQLGDALGSDDAPVTIQVLNDMQCLRCAEYQVDVIAPLIEGPVRDGDVRLVFRHYPVGSNATSAASFAAVAAGEQDHQWQYIQVFALNQGIAREEGVSDELLERIAGAVLGLDVGLWAEERDLAAVSERVEADARLTAELRLTAEPALIVEGAGGSITLEDAPSLERIEAAIAEAG